MYGEVRGAEHLMKDQESFYDHVRAGESKLNDLESEIMRYIIELRDDIDDVTLKSVARTVLRRSQYNRQACP